MKFRNISKMLLLNGYLLAKASILGADGDRPNIMLVLLDDVGWKDLGSYGGAFDTPNLDRLASEGARFTNSYSPAPICSASRVSILTGKSPARSHFEFVTKWPDDEPKIEGHSLIPPPFTLNMELEEVTIAESLLKAGYSTAFFGKWHVATHHEVYKGWSPTHGPLQQGFEVAEEDFGNHPYAADYPAVDPTSFKRGEYPRDSLTDRALNYLGQDHQDPFFLMVSYYHVHTPVKAPARWLKDKYLKILPRDERRERRSEYGAFVEAMDLYVGQLLTMLDERDLQKNTLVVVTSDNGGHPAYALHAPLRGSKWTVYEGGIRVPMLVRFPGVCEAGIVVNKPVVGTDLYATYEEVARLEGSDLDDSASFLPLLNSEASDATEGRSLVWHFPYYNPEPYDLQRRLTIGVDDNENAAYRPMSAIRLGDYKLIRNYEDDRVELYNLKTDIGEQFDLSVELPEKTLKLRRALRDYLSSVDARMPSLNY